MKYYIVDSDMQIKSVYGSLRELRETLADVDLSDYVDDLDKRLDNGDGIVSDDFIQSLLEEKQNSENNSASEMMDVQVKISELEEQLDLFKEENNSVHEEVISLETKLTSTENTLSESEKEKAEVTKSLVKANHTIQKYTNVLENCKDNRASLVVSKAVDVLNGMVEDIKHSEKEINRFKGELTVE